MGRDGNIGLDATKRPVRVPPEFAHYLEKHDVFRTLENLMQNVLIDKPDDPLEWMIQFLKGPEVPKIFVGGPPAVGKHAVCAHVSEKCGAVIVDVPSVVAKAVTDDPTLGKELETDKVTELLVARLKEEDCRTKGYLLCGYPKTRPQALMLQMAGILPTQYILLEAPDEVVEQRAEGRLDGADKETYHKLFKPAPEGVKCKPRPTDQEAVLQEALKTYKRNALDIELSYQSVMRKVAADQPLEDVKADVFTAVCIKPYSNAPTVPRILLLGPPGAGKRTQANILANKYNLVHVSMDDLRYQAMSGSRTRSAAAYRAAHEEGEADAAVPDKVLFALVCDRLKMLDCQTQGWALEGFPMTPAQADMLDREKFVPSRVFFLEVPDETVSDRLTTRKVDPITGDRYKVGGNYAPPATDGENERLRQHPLDAPDKVDKRLEHFKEYQEALRAKYPSLTNINADQEHHTVHQCIDGRLVMPILPDPASS